MALDTSPLFAPLTVKSKTLRNRIVMPPMVGRGLVADADWPHKVREGRFDEVATCIKCDNCSADLRAGCPVGCMQWN
jgi:2,4-dienoyl-CoA reductase-like NADH-dependent reductase (Old Yellow Enzyme family)